MGMRNDERRMTSAPGNRPELSGLVIRACERPCASGSTCVARGLLRSGKSGPVSPLSAPDPTTASKRAASAGTGSSGAPSGVRSWFGDRARCRRLAVLLACQITYSVSMLAWFALEEPDWRLAAVVAVPVIASGVIAHRVHEKHRRRQQDRPVLGPLRDGPDGCRSRRPGRAAPGRWTATGSRPGGGGAD